MNTKLTLKLDQEVIERAKKYASNQKLSLSKLVEAYLQSLTSKKDTDELEISPFVRSISTGKKIAPDLDYKEEYSDHLLEKYK